MTTTLDEMVQALKEWCRGQPVRLCVLFGSQATGKTHPGSDVDVAVWPDESLTTAVKLGWVVELEDMLDREVSLVLVSPNLDPVLGFEIVRNGQLVFESEPGSWIRQRAQLWHAYNDSLPFRRLAREQLRQFAEEVRRGT